jgi:hypothetical protein
MFWIFRLQTVPFLYTNVIYIRETMAKFNYDMQQMSFIHTLHFYATQIINPFLNLRISVNHDKVYGISANVGQTCI